MHQSCWEFKLEVFAIAQDVVQGLMGQFVEYIKECKTVALEDLAAEFGLRVQVSHSLLHGHAALLQGADLTDV